MAATVLPFLSPFANTALAEASGPSQFDLLPQRAKDEAYAAHAMIQPALEKMRRGVSAKAAAKWLRATSPDGTMPSLPTLERMLASGGDLYALAPKHKGRIRKDGGWEKLAHELYILPGQPSYAAIARRLREEHGFGDDATAGRVQTYIESLPKHETEFHPKRIGHNTRRLNFTPHKIRDRSDIPVGLIYQGDGHALHYYVRHPIAGHHFTAELTPWMDIASRYIAGWWLGYAESARQVLWSMCHAITAHDHVPALFHVDPGSGNINKLMCDEVAGFVPRIGAEYMKALPANARGKGDIEGWFKWFEADHGVFQSGFKGDKVPQEFLRNLTRRIEKGEVYVQSWDEALHGIGKAITRYNERNQDDLGKRSPAALFEKLDRSPLHVPASVLVRPRERRMARSYRVELFNRVYQAPALRAYEGVYMQVEYDLHADGRVWIYDEKGRFVTEALKVATTRFVSESRERDLQINREAGRIRRLEQRADLIKAEGMNLITTAASVVDALEGEFERVPAVEAPLTPGRLPQPPKAAPKAVRAIDSAEHRLVTDYITEANAEVEETAEQRFGRWLDMRDDIGHGVVFDDAALSWMRIYERSTEHAGLNDVYEAFGYLPGLTRKAKGPAPTEPFGNAVPPIEG